MTKHENITFTGRASWQTLENHTYRRCTFDNCLIPRADTPEVRRVIRNVSLTDTTQRACWIVGAALEDITITGLKRLGDFPLFLEGNVFRHVILRGRITSIKINRSLQPGGVPDQASWDQANSTYYQGVDWALDITEAIFTGGVSLEAIPGTLIRRDPATQVLVSRDKLPSDWSHFDFGKTAFDIALSWFMNGSLFDNVVLVAPRGSRTFKDDLAVLQRLRSEGLAE